MVKSIMDGRWEKQILLLQQHCKYHSNSHCVDEGTETEKLSDLPYLLQNQEPAIARFQNDLTAYFFVTLQNVK